MIEAAYDRIAAAIQRSGGSRFIVVLVPPHIPLLPATEKLRTHLQGRGITVRPIRVEERTNLIEAIEVDNLDPSEVALVYGLEALSQADRESFLRASSFARTRLQGIPVAVILVLGTETWSWLGLELPDLARWADGPFLVSDGGKGTELRAPVPRLGRRPLAASAILLDDQRNVDIQGPVEEWIDRGGVLTIGGPRGVGVTHLAVRIETRLAELDRRTASTENVHLVNGVPMVGGSELVGDPEVPFPRTFSVLPLEDWLEHHRSDVVFIARQYWHPSRVTTMANKGMTGVVLGPSAAALTQARIGTQIYLPPVQVVERDGSEHARGIERMVEAVLADADRYLQLDLKTILPQTLLSALAYASGGLPGMLWSLVIQALQRVLRLGSSTATTEIIQSVILDVASARPTIPEDAIVSAVRENLLDFELEAQGAVLFYLIDGQLCTMRHPLSMLAARLRAASESRTFAPTRAPRRRRRPRHEKR